LQLPPFCQIERHRIVPVIDAVIPVTDIEKAFQVLVDSSQFGKVVVDMWPATPVPRL
jgi:hypothetical protein